MTLDREDVTAIAKETASTVMWYITATIVALWIVFEGYGFVRTILFP